VDYSNGKHCEEIAYGVTSLKKDKASAERLLVLNRGHWEIENRVHYVRDVTFDEDRSRIRVKNGPRVMASIRNLVISILRLMGFRYISDGIRHYCYSWDLEDTCRLLGI